MEGANIDRDIIKDFEKDMFRAKRAIVVAIVFAVLFIGAFGTVYLAQDWFIESEEKVQLVALEAYAPSFMVYFMTTPCEVNVERTLEVDICLIASHLYEDASTDAIFESAEKAEYSTTEFHFEGDLEEGEWVIYWTLSSFDDVVVIKVIRKMISPCILWIFIVIVLLVLLCMLRVGLKIRRLGKIKQEREDYLQRMAARPKAPPSPFGWGGGGKPPPGEVPIYEANYRPQQQPRYSEEDMSYFTDAEDEVGGSGTEKGFLDFMKPSDSSKEDEEPRRPPRRREDRGEFSSSRPPRPAFAKKDKYGFKGRRGGKEEKPEREPPKKDKYGFKGGGKVKGKEKEKPKEKPPSREKPSKKPGKGKKKKEEESGYLEFDDFD